MAWLLDTNVLSELRRPKPEPKVVAFVAGQPLDQLQANRRAAEQRCLSVENGPPVGHPYAMGEEYYQIFVCRGLRLPLPQLWPLLKHWN